MHNLDCIRMSSDVNFFLCFFLLFSRIHLSTAKILQPISTDLDHSSVLLDIIYEFYVKNSIKFDFIIYGAGNSDIIDIIGSSNYNNFSYRIMHIKTYVHYISLKKSAVIFVLNINDLNNFNSKVELTNSFAKNLIFVVYLSDFTNFFQHEN